MCYLFAWQDWILFHESEFAAARPLRDNTGNRTFVQVDVTHAPAPLQRLASCLRLPAAMVTVVAEFSDHNG